MHVLCTRVPRCLGVASSASSLKVAQALGCSFTPGLWISFGRVTCMARAASVPGLWTLVFLPLRGACASFLVSRQPRHSWLGSWVGVFGYGFWLRPSFPSWSLWCVRLGLGFGSHPAIPCWGFWRAWLCARSARTPPLLAGVSSVAVCAMAWVAATPRHFWPGCWGMCVPVCVVSLYPATPGRGVWIGSECLGAGSRCPRATPGYGVGVCVCVCVCTLLVPRHSWLGCAVWLCVLGLGFRAAPRHFWLGCPGVGVFVCAFRLVPCSFCLGLRCEGVRLSLAFGCAPPLLVWVLGSVCVCVRSPLVPRNSWPGPAVWVHVLELWFLAAPRKSWPGCWLLFVFVCAVCLYLATLGGVVFVCVGSDFACSPFFFWVWFWLWPLGCAASVSCHLLVGLPVARRCAGVAVGGVCPHPVPPPFFSGLRGRGVVLGPVVSPLSGVCRCPSRSWVSGDVEGWLVEWVCGFAAVCLSLAPPPFFPSVLFVCYPSPFFSSGGVCLFCPLPSLGWCTHWLAFSVANRVAVGWAVPRPHGSKEGPYQDRPPLCPFRL